MASDNVQILTDSSFDAAVKSGVTLVDFWAEWCGPCKRIGPAVEELAGDYKGRAAVAKVNVDDNPGMVGRFGIRGIPMLLVLKNGDVVEQVVGVQSKQQLASLIDKHL